MHKKTLGLHMIVGSGEAHLLNRCLTSFHADKYFEQIAINVTCQDRNVLEEARRWTDRVTVTAFCDAVFPFGNFARARNVALDMLTTDYVMWLDADDTLSADFLPAMWKIRTALDVHDFDYYFVPYNISITSAGAVDRKTMRERIFKRLPELCWKYPVHEGVTVEPYHRNASFSNIAIDHRPVKLGSISTDRNLKILEAEIAAGRGSDEFLRFCYTGELLSRYRQTKDAGYKSLAVSAMESLLETRRRLSKNTIALVAYRIAKEYLYSETDGSKLELRTENLNRAETYANLSVCLDSRFAEPIFILGEIANLRGEGMRAIRLYEQAMTKKGDCLDEQEMSFYEELPLRRLVEVCVNEKKFEEALLYHKHLDRFQDKEDWAKDHLAIMKAINDIMIAEGKCQHLASM